MTPNFLRVQTARSRHLGLLPLLLLAPSLLGACTAEITSPSPVAGAVSPNLVCTAQNPVHVTIRGDKFNPMPRGVLEDSDLVLPTLALTRSRDIQGGPASDPSIVYPGDPKLPNHEPLSWTSTTEMGLDFSAASPLPAGIYDLRIQNPDGERRVDLSGALAAIDPPTITSINPTAICDDQADQVFTLTGTNFLEVAGSAPTVTVGSKSYPSQAASCTPIPGNFLGASVQLCTSLAVTVPRGDLPPGKYAVSVSDPSGVSCSSKEAIELEVHAPPSVTHLGKPTVCSGGSVVTVFGTGFLPGASVSVTCGASTVTAQATNIATDGTSLTANLGAVGAAGDSCEVTVKNLDGCQDRPTPHQMVTVTDGPFLYLVAPEVTYSGTDTAVQLYLTSLVSPATVSLMKGATQVNLPAPLAVPSRPNRLSVTVPKGLEAGAWNVTVADGSGCAATLPNGVAVLSTPTTTLLKVDPAFGSTSDDAPITIRRDAAAPAPANQPFVGSPRVYLIKNGASAIEASAVTRVDNDTLTAVVPKGTAIGDYDLVVAGSDGSLAVLPFDATTPGALKGFRELAGAVPQVNSLAPSSITTQVPQTFSVQGGGFNAGAIASLQCKTASGASSTPPVSTGAVLCNGNVCTLPVTVTSGVSAGDVCMVHVANTDGSYVDYSALGVTNPSLNLNSPKAGSNLVVGRRALGLFAGEPTSATRLLYAIGGDDGTDAGVLGSVESAPIDPFGGFGAFALQSSTLAHPRAFAGTAGLGRYVYVVGGHGAAGPEATVERALVLSPREVPSIDDIDIALVRTGAGLPSGSWRYRVSATFTATDLDNPLGESLPSDPITLKLPPNNALLYRPTILWSVPVDAAGTPLPNIAGYRIFRAAANGDPSTERLLAAVPAGATSFTDDGSAVLGADVPVMLGSLGKFATLASLATARESLGIAASVDPSNASAAYIYALGGRSAGNTTPTTYEYLPLTITPGGHQTPAAAWKVGAQSFGAGRVGASGFVVGTDILSTVPTADKYIYFGPGVSATGTAVNDVRAGKIAAGGELTIVDVTSDPNGTSTNYGALAANGQLFLIGGGTSPSGGARSASITAAPQLASNAWNAGALSLIRSRTSFGLAAKSAFVFFAGGSTNEPSLASRTTEFVVR